MENTKNSKKVSSEDAGDMLVPEEFIKIIATILLGFMVKLKKAAGNDDPVAGFMELQSELKRAKMLDNAIQSGGACPECGSSMRSDGSFSIQLFSTAIIFLLKHRMITPKSFTLPSLEMLTRELCEGFSMAMDMKCEDCGFETLNPSKIAN